MSPLVDGVDSADDPNDSVMGNNVSHSVIYLLWNPKNLSFFKNAMLVYPKISVNFDVLLTDNLYDILCLAINEAAVESDMIVFSDRKFAKYLSKSWFDKSCVEMKRELHAKLRECEQENFAKDESVLCAGTKSRCKSLLNNKRRYYYKSLLDILANETRLFCLEVNN